MSGGLYTAFNIRHIDLGRHVVLPAVWPGGPSQLQGSKLYSTSYIWSWQDQLLKPIALKHILCPSVTP